MKISMMAFETTIAVNSVPKIPIISVTAKPWMGPVPRK
jgi:hypothetical protein